MSIKNRRFISENVINQKSARIQGIQTLFLKVGFERVFTGIVFWLLFAIVIEPDRTAELGLYYSLAVFQEIFLIGKCFFRSFLV